MRVEPFGQDNEVDGREPEVGEGAGREFGRFGEVAVRERLSHHIRERGE